VTRNKDLYLVYFCSQEQLDCWKRLKPLQIFVDGYHKIPDPFQQLLTIMGYSSSLKVAFPIFHCLMNCKTENAYKQVFTDLDGILQTIYNDREEKFQPVVVTTGFEKALLNAVKWAWPKARQLGCFVHFLRAQINRLKSLGFAGGEFKRQRYKLLTLMSTLPFTQLRSVPASFEAITKLFPTFHEYFSYFRETWLDGMFSIEVWNILNKLTISPTISETLKHSNNQIESFHSLLNYCLLKSAKPEIGEVIDALKYIEIKATSDLNEFENREIIPVIILYN